MSFFTDLAEFQFLQYAVLAALLSSLLAGSMGTFIVIRRSTYVAGAVSHSALGGIGVARYLQVQFGWQWLDPMIGAILSALLTSAIIAWVRARDSEREDTILSAIWALGMAVGITFMSLTPGYAQDLLGYLFGDILLVTPADLIALTLTALIALAFLFWNYDRLLAVSFNAQLAELRGAKPFLLEIAFTVITALTVVVLVRMVGIVLVIALLTLPAATASRLMSNLLSTMLVAILISALTLVVGIWIAYEFNLPTGATVIELSTLLYITTFIWKRKE